MKVSILGSCVTRDAFAHHEDVLGRPDRYFARSGLASAMSRTEFGGVDLSSIESDFQRRMVAQDLTGEFAEWVRLGDFDVLVYDAIDERFALLVRPSGAVATRSAEFTRAQADIADCVVVKPSTEKFYRRWEAAWAELVTVLRESGRLDRLRINQVYWASRFAVSGPAFPAQYSDERIARSNRFLERLYARMAADLSDHQFFRYTDDELIAAGEHRWGLAPFHYRDVHYRRFADQLLAVSASPPGGLRRWWRGRSSSRR